MAIKKGSMTPRERLLTAAKREKADRVPLEFSGTSEVWEKLKAHFGTGGHEEIWEHLHLDSRWGASPAYIGPPEVDLGNGRRRVPPWWNTVEDIGYGSGSYQESVESPLVHATSIAELEQFNWPSADWYDFSTIEDQASQYPDRAVSAGYVAPFYWLNHLRGLEQSCIDLIAEPEMTAFMLQKIEEFAWEYNCRLFEAGKGKIDFTEVTDDFGSQRDLLISEASYRQWFKPLQKKFVDLAHGAGVMVLHHDDGAIRKLIPDFIEVGMDMLNPVQHTCPGMELFDLKRDFGDQISFHGGVDNQQVLAYGTDDEVRREVRYCLEALSPGGGYILAPCHAVQPVTSVETLLVMYETAWEEGWY